MGIWASTVSYSTSSTISAQYTYNGEFSLNFSCTVTTGASFSVPSGYRGNIKYKAEFLLQPQRYKYTLSDGTITYSEKFYNRIFHHGGFYLVKVKV